MRYKLRGKLIYFGIKPETVVERNIVNAMKKFKNCMLTFDLLSITSSLNIQPNKLLLRLYKNNSIKSDRFDGTYWKFGYHFFFV